MEIDYHTNYHSFSNQHSIYSDSSFFREKQKEKSGRINKHHKEIFNVYTGWINQSFSVNVNLTNFDLNNLEVKVIKQIVPIEDSSNMKLTSLWSKAISHLNCDDYIDAHNKFNEIKNLENNFNNSIKHFINIHKSNLIKLIKLKNSDSEESLNMSLRYIFCKTIEYHNQTEGVSTQLDDFRPITIVDNDELESWLELSNPFPEKETELKEYLKKNYSEIIKSIKKFEKDIKNFENPVKEFKDRLILIEQNKLDGLKGRCSVDKHSTLFERVKSWKSN